MKALVGVLSAILLGDVTGNIGQTAYGLSEAFYASAPLGSTSEDKASSTRA